MHANCQLLASLPYNFLLLRGFTRNIRLLGRNTRVFDATCLGGRDLKRTEHLRCGY